MLFNSASFLIFFPIVLLVYFAMPKKVRYVWLLVASYYFYMSWNPVYALLLLGVTVVTYICSLLIAKERYYFIDKKSAKMKWFLVIGICINLGLLFYFKYIGFFISSINGVLSRIHVSTIGVPDVVLPVGVSFFTFQALGYLIDVYRGDTKVEYNFLKYALFVSFFPQLVAGPIERSENLLEQIREDAEHLVWNYSRVTRGLMLMLWGFFVKMVIADRAAISVDYIFNHYEQLGFVELSTGAILFAIQIYCDFGGYSYIAIGAARVLGYELMDNFNTPYFATNVSDFWRRWHISLSQWLRDYVYIPLGGNQCSRFRHYLNLLITFGVSGLWHGANWTYVVWGLLHGFYQIVEKIMQKPMKWIHEKCHTRKESFGYRVCMMFGTLVVVDFAWIFFRANSIGQAIAYIYRMFSHWNPWAYLDGTLYNQIGLSLQETHILWIAILILVMVDWLQYTKQKNFAVLLENQWVVFRYVVIFFLIWFTIILGSYGEGFNSANFIYFQF